MAASGSAPPLETYEAFKARALREFDGRHAGRPLQARQRLLRVHLRHFLLTVGVEIDGEQRRDKGCAAREQQEGDKAKVDEAATTRAFFTEQKRLALTREAARASRQKSARILQRFFHSHRRMIMTGDAVNHSEVELLSSSEFIAIETPMGFLVGGPTPSNLESGETIELPSRADAPPPYEVNVELLAARGFAIDFMSSPASSLIPTMTSIEAELRLMSACSEMASVESTTNSPAIGGGDLQWDGCSLRFSIDPSAVVGYAVTPQTVVDEWKVAVTVKASSIQNGSDTTRVLGVLDIPLSLLETPLALQYAICRWFPLERAYPGHTARGELRISVRYLMRPPTVDSTKDGGVMIPYVGLTKPESPPNIADQRAVNTRNKPSIRRVKKPSLTSNAQRSVLPKASSKAEPRKSSPIENAGHVLRGFGKLRPPILSLKDAPSSPIGRISRAEVLSPPSSPSSVTSSETGEGASPIDQDGGEGEAPVKTPRRVLSPKRQQQYVKPTVFAVQEELQANDESIEKDESRSPAKAAQPFLKRKPYKVVFRKLDWSSVTAKTNSNWATRTSNGTNRGETLRPAQPAEYVGRSDGNKPAMRGSRDAVAPADSTNDSTCNGYIDADTAARLAALEVAVYERCGVTGVTAPLARLKYQSERKKFVASLQSQLTAEDTSGPEPSPPAQEPGHEGSSTSNGAILYGVDSVGLDGEVKKFEKPIFQTWLMFLAMVFALPIHWAYHWHVERQWRRNNRTGMKYHYRIPRKMYFLLALPAAFDLFATFLANIGLMYVTVSVFQLMKCTVIVFVALLKVFALKDRLRSYMWIGIALNMLAALMVGATSLADADSQENNAATQHPGFGILMIVLSCAIQAVQYVFEEKLMDEGDSAPPLVVVGMEGVWGLLLTSFIVYPVAYLIPGSDLGSNERFDDAYEMLVNSKLAQIVVLIYLLVILGYNVFAVSVTYLLNSIWHAILDNFRPITVWGMDLLLFYLFTQGAFGECWTIWSWLQLTGMITLLVGTAVYNGTIRLPGFVYLEPLEESLTPIRTPEALAASTFSRSPLISRNALKAAEIARRTPNANDRDRVRREFMTEYQPLADPEARRRIDPAGHTYGSLEN
ncbi:hypothetical protein BBJ28_00008462 [Nothophytophthora sp. Chile5]|nr:hypothetical protein BBJ28_00008462 [Nothophytophthora sp. Chile5]